MSAPMTLYVATSNAGKLRDFAAATEVYARSKSSRCAVVIRPMDHLETIDAPPENGSSFAENAIAKAAYYSLRAPGKLVVADDSGLAVDALDGAPGVYSARYAERAGFVIGGAAADENNNAHLVAELSSVLSSEADHLAKRSARYHCVLAVGLDGKCVTTAEGLVEGRILPSPRGNGGFGYDPLFLVPELGRTMAELDISTRLGLSHRGRAIEKLLQLFEDDAVER